MSRLDAAAEPFAEQLRGHLALDAVFYAASAVAEHGILWQVLAWSQWLRGRRSAALRASGGLAVESLVVNGLLKSVTRRARPQGYVEHPFPLRRPVTSSFPSGHASAAAFAVVVLAECDPLWPLYMICGTAVAWSRVHVRLHHPSDVVAGAATGAFLGTLARTWFPLEAHMRTDPGIVGAEKGLEQP